MLEKKPPEITLSESHGVRALHLGTPWIQGTMLIKEPYKIELEYVQRMMTWLLFTPVSLVKEALTMQLGLGSAAISKCCYKILGMHAVAIEVNPKVINACKQWFRLPISNKRFEIVLADAAKEIKSARWQMAVHALAVDLYDQDAAAPVMDSLGFYADCRAVLTLDGMMTVNLFGRHYSYFASLEKIKQVFGEDCVWAFKPTREGNTVVLAFRTKPTTTRESLFMQAETIESRWADGGLPAKKWMKLLSHHLSSLA